MRPRPPGRLPEPAILIQHITGHVGSPRTVTAIHFAFSIVTGALYGALVEVLPIVGIGMGVGYGLAVWAIAHELVMPLIGLTPPLARLPVSEQINEAITHGIWGWVIELVRHDLRGRLVTRRSFRITASER